MRSLWKGALSFGLVTIPVRLYAATESKDVHFRYLHAPCMAPVQYRKVCSACDKEAPPEEIALGVETSPGQFVTFREEELSALPAGTGRAVEIERFVSQADVDAIFFAKAYYLEPEPAAQKAYALLHRAMRDEGRAAVVRITLRRRERWALVRAGASGALLMETLLDADEVRAPDGLAIPEGAEVRPIEEKLARDLIEALAGEFRPEEQPDRYREALGALIRDKAEREAVPAATPAAASGRVVDLMEALRASIAERGSAAAPAGGGRRRSRSRAAKDTAAGDAPPDTRDRGEEAAEDGAEARTPARSHAGKGDRGAV